jgi:hypothetical protein
VEAARLSVTDPDLATAWDELRAALPRGWVTGRPAYHHEDRTWHLYAHDPAERPKVGKRTREATAVGESEVECVRAMARILAVMGQGRWPK